MTLLLDTPAHRNDGSPFRDHDVHRPGGQKHQEGRRFEARLTRCRRRWPSTSGKPYDAPAPLTGMRPEQEEAVAQTAGYFRSHADDGKGTRVSLERENAFWQDFYQLPAGPARMGWKRILVLTYKPVVQTAWKEDLLTHTDFEGWTFVDRESSPDDRDAAADAAGPVVWFASFQDTPR